MKFNSTSHSSYETLSKRPSSLSRHLRQIVDLPWRRTEDAEDGRLLYTYSVSPMVDACIPPAADRASSNYGGRDLIGYAGKGMPGTWPGGAVVAINFVINFEEGGESCLLHGDQQSEHLLSEIVGATPYGKSAKQEQEQARRAEMLL